MIVEWLVAVGASLSTWFAGLFPDWSPPDFIVHFGDTLNGVLANLDGVGAWVDWAFIVPITAAVVLVWGITFVIKIVRAVASYLPFIGGAG